MKKNFVKKLALGLALVMAVTSVPASSEAAAAPGFKSDAVKVRVGQTKKYSTENSKKYSVKFKIGNKSVATIKYTAGSKSVKVTGVAEGKTTLRADFKSYKTKKVTTAKVPVTVLAAKEEAPVVTTPELATVKQTASNAFEVTFTADARETVTLDSFTAIESADALYSAYVKTVDFSTDGKSAIVTTYGNFANGITYNVTCAGKTASFTASVGKVVSAVITTVKAEQNVDTDIEFKLLDAAGMDVTPSIDVDTYVTLDVEGNADFDVKETSTATILMSEVNETATVTLVYDALDGSEEVKVTGTVVCIAAQAVKGANTVFTAGNDQVYLKSYKPATTIYEYEEGATYGFTFAALDKNGFAIEYDEFEVESANEDVVVVEDIDEYGTFVRIFVSPEKVGTTKLIIKATKNEVTTLYSEVITVKAEPELKAVSLSATSITVSNTARHDNDNVKVYFMNQYGTSYYDVNTTAEMFNDDKDPNVIMDYDQSLVGSLGFATVKIDAVDTVDAEDKSDAFVVAVKASDDNNNEFTKKFTVKVRKPSSTTPTYKVELSTNSVDLNPEVRTPYMDITGNVKAKLASYQGSVFTGYVDSDEVYVSRGSKYYNDTVLAYEGNECAKSAGNLKDSYTSTAGITFNTAAVSGDAVYLIAGNGVAETGTYKVTMTTPDDKERTATFTVKNTMEVPTVKVIASKDKKDEAVNGLTLAQACISVDVDALLAARYGFVSIEDVYGKDNGLYVNISDSTDKDIDVRRIRVRDTFYDYIMGYGHDYVYQLSVKADLDLD